MEIILVHWLIKPDKTEEFVEHWKSNMKIGKADGFYREPYQPGLVSQGFIEGRSQADADILNGVVRVDTQVPFAGNIQVEHPMFRQQRQHMVQKLDSCLNISRTGPVQV